MIWFNPPGLSVPKHNNDQINRHIGTRPVRRCPRFTPCTLLPTYINIWSCTKISLTVYLFRGGSVRNFSKNAHLNMTINCNWSKEPLTDDRNQKMSPVAVFSVAYVFLPYPSNGERWFITNVIHRYTERGGGVFECGEYKRIYTTPWRHSNINPGPRQNSTYWHLLIIYDGVVASHLSGHTSQVFIVKTRLNNKLTYNI